MAIEETWQYSIHMTFHQTLDGTTTNYDILRGFSNSDTTGFFSPYGVQEMSSGGTVYGVYEDFHYHHVTGVYTNTFYYTPTFYTGSSNDIHFKHSFYWIRSGTTWSMSSTQGMTAWWHHDMAVNGNSVNYAKDQSPANQCTHEQYGRPVDWVNYQFWDSTSNTYSVWTHKDYITKTGPVGYDIYSEWGIFQDTLDSNLGSKAQHDYNDNDEHVDGYDLWGSWLIKANGMSSGSAYTGENYFYTSWS
jgi:hypothetical protein